LLFGPARLILRLLSLFVTLVVVYFAVTLVQVWLTSRHDSPRKAGSIIVMGAAQYNGLPSPDLKARLDEARQLFRQGFASLIVVTGNKEKSDRFTEAEAGAHYLERHGVPSSDIRQAGGDDSYQNLQEAAPVAKGRDQGIVLIVTDPFHEYRSMAIATDLGLEPYPTPTSTSPITGWSTVPYFLKEAVGAGIGRLFGYQHLSQLHAVLG
jgi:uncharacterized SAM-binding protein YcdF (DUF218 family)